MTPERLNELNEEGATSDDLTAEERAEGWHYCPEADGRLAQAEDPDLCICKL